MRDGKQTQRKSILSTTKLDKTTECGCTIMLDKGGCNRSTKCIAIKFMQQIDSIKSEREGSRHTSRYARLNDVPWILRTRPRDTTLPTPHPHPTPHQHTPNHTNTHTTHTLPHTHTLSSTPPQTLPTTQPQPLPPNHAAAHTPRNTQPTLQCHVHPTRTHTRTNTHTRGS